jgi:phosphate transport system substrate-binding protein
MKPMFKYVAVLLGISALLVSSCKSYNNKQINTETPTRGNIKIAVDESYKLLSDAEIEVFTSMYKYAHINPIYASEDSILSLFMKDSVRLMITSRKLTANEENFLKSKLIIARTTQIAWDAVAFVVNKNNADSLIAYNTIGDIFSGKVNSWKQVNPKSKLGKMEVVFDNQGSSNVRFLLKKFEQSALPEICYASKSNPSVIDYVESHPNALGIISVNWVSDKDDSITHSFLNRVRVVAVSPEEFSEGDDYYKPHPGYIADKSYPFVREVYAISRESFAGLGRGFIQYVASDQGQRIVLKMGMLPATMPIRLVQISKE